MKKLSARWVPRLLTVDQKQQRVDDSTAGLALLQRNRADFFRRFVTMDETWVHYYTPEANRQSAEWLKSHESRPKRPKDQHSARKIIASVFWDAHSIIFIYYLQKGRIVMKGYYAVLLDKLNDEIKKKWPHMAKKKVLYHYDNAPSHTSLKAPNWTNYDSNWLPTVFSRLGPQRLLSVPKPTQAVTPGKEIHFE